jgi:hypothetical protein
MGVRVFSNVSLGDIAVVVLGVGFFAGPLAAIGIASLHHRGVHRRLGIAPGWSAQCPICVDEDEHRHMPWHVRYSRDLKRKQLKREEFDSGRG